MELVLNDPHNDPDALVFALRIKVRKDMTLKELKEQIADIIKLKPNEFVVKRYTATREYKTMDSTLAALGLSNGNLIKIEIGSPHLEGFYEVRIC